MILRPRRPTPATGLPPGAPASPPWAESTQPPPIEAAPAGPAPSQLPLFTFEDTPPPRQTRMQRLRGLLAALDASRAAPPPAAGAPIPAEESPAAGPAPWPDSFFNRD